MEGTPSKKPCVVYRLLFAILDLLFFVQERPRRAWKHSLIARTVQDYNKPPEDKEKYSIGLKFYNPDPKISRENAIRSLAAAVDQRPAPPGTVVAAGEHATWGVDGVASQSVAE